MKQLLILSGKGGTGKTTVASALIRLLDVKAFADCDVDAPNLHLLNKVEVEPEKDAFYGLQKAHIDESLCINCGACKEHCRFDAIDTLMDKGSIVGYQVAEFGCEGCSVCESVCPTGAISLGDSSAGDLTLYRGQKIFSTAKLKMGNGTTGMIVTQVKKRMKNGYEEAENISRDKSDIVIIDGSPGIGCPVIASITGVDLVLVVAEPSVSGISDLKRIVETTRIFGTDLCVCVNKWDNSRKNTEAIIAYCEQEKISFVGKIPYDANAMKAVNNGQSIVDVECESGTAIKNILERLVELIEAE